MALGGAAIMLIMTAFPVAGADAAQETTSSLRAKRQVLVQRIAALTDEMSRAESRAADAERRRAMSQAALDVARRRFAAHAVGAYLDGVQDTEDEQLRRRAWGDALAAPEREVVDEYRAAKVQAAKEAIAAETAIADAGQLASELDAARARLERTITDRVRYERALSKASRRPASSAGGTRHQRATFNQAELMRLYRFGPTDGVPAGLVATGEVLDGRASWYGPGFDGRATASGAIFDQEGWTVAHRTLPLGTILKISHGGRSVVVLVNDRGPFVSGRILDLSHGVANYLGTVHAGVAPVHAEVLVPL
jgi:rare lipoprotein A (peptidoglycan hydrolase)